MEPEFRRIEREIGEAIRERVRKDMRKWREREKFFKRPSFRGDC